jgi:hypothetical protein
MRLRDQLLQRLAQGNAFRLETHPNRIETGFVCARISKNRRNKNE